MATVLCTLPNAAELINGVRFTPSPLGMISEDIPEEAAARFASIPGYVRIPDADTVFSSDDTTPVLAVETTVDGTAPRRRGRLPKVTPPLDAP